MAKQKKQLLTFRSHQQFSENSSDQRVDDDTGSDISSNTSSMDMEQQDENENPIVKNQRAENLKKYYKDRSENLDNLKKTINKMIKQQKEDMNSPVQNNQQKGKLVPYEHFFTNLMIQNHVNKKVFFHVYKIDKMRCNMRVFNQNGFLLSYLSDIKVSRRFHKIYKILKDIGNKAISIIFDEASQNPASETPFIVLLKDYSFKMCYCSKFIDKQKALGSFRKQIQGQNRKSRMFEDVKQQADIDEQERKTTLKNEKNIEKKKQKVFIRVAPLILIKDDYFWLYSNTFGSEAEAQKQLTQMLKNFISIQQQSLHGEENSDNTRLSFIANSIFVNLFKVNKFATNLQMYNKLLQMIEQQEDSSCRNSQNVSWGQPSVHNNVQKMSYMKQCAECKKKQAQTNTGKSRNKVKKTKYRCEGCSAQAKRDVPVCITCMDAFHQRLKRNQLKNKKKAISKLRQSESKVRYKRKKKVIPDDYFMSDEIQIQEDKKYEQSLMKQQKKQQIVKQQYQYSYLNDSNLNQTAKYLYPYRASDENGKNVQGYRMAKPVHKQIASGCKDMLKNYKGLENINNQKMKEVKIQQGSDSFSESQSDDSLFLQRQDPLQSALSGNKNFWRLIEQIQQQKQLLFSYFKNLIITQESKNCSVIMTDLMRMQILEKDSYIQLKKQEQQRNAYNNSNWN